MEHLIARQARRQPLAKSTIQEKFSGSSALTLSQALSIVEAMAEYARKNNLPLPAREISPETWRDRIVTATAIGETKSKSTQPPDAHIGSTPYNIEPLKQAEMHDLVELVLQNQGNPPSTWLPSVIRGMLDAEMTIADFLKRAAEGSPLGIVQTLRALEDIFSYTMESETPWEHTKRNHENSITVGQLVGMAALQHGVSASPAIVVGLRRQKLGHHVEDFLTRIATSHLAPKIETVADHLRSASLKNDAERLLHAIGTNRRADRIYEVLLHFATKGKQEDVDLILRGIGRSDKWRLRTVAQELEKTGISNEARHKIAKAVEYGRHEEYAQHLAESNLTEWAEAIRAHSDDLPF
ncbi:hypothetical protein OG235_28820 [Streptomyces sp. NBC_00024]|uniref:hypothetical protein n=1 Tax=Streptomyces sp. NBC_00024 TaxID=2903612 RepID=UPI003248B1BD